MYQKKTKKEKHRLPHQKEGERPPPPEKDKNGKLSQDERKKLLKIYTKGSAAFGSKKNLQRASNLSKEKVSRFLETLSAHSKYGDFPKTFPRLKVVAYDINEIWSIDLAYVDKLEK